MKIKGQLQWTDYLQSQLLHLQPTGLARLVRYSFLAFLGCGFIDGLYLSVAGQLPFEWVIPVIPVVGFVAIYRYILLPQRVKRIFFQQKDLSVPFEIEITDAGLNASNEFGNSIRPWKNFNKWKENKELLILYHSDVLYSILPKRLFPDPQQIEMIKTYLENNKVPAAKSRFQVSCIIFIILFIIVGWMLYINLSRGISQ